MKKIFLSIIILLFSFWQALSLGEDWWYAVFSREALEKEISKLDTEIENATKYFLKLDLNTKRNSYFYTESFLKIKLEQRDAARFYLKRNLEEVEKSKRERNIHLFIWIWIFSVFLLFMTFVFRNKNI